VAKAGTKRGTYIAIEQWCSLSTADRYKAEKCMRSIANHCLGNESILSRVEYLFDDQVMVDYHYTLSNELGQERGNRYCCTYFISHLKSAINHRKSIDIQIKETNDITSCRESRGFGTNCCHLKRTVSNLDQVERVFSSRHSPPM
jgi:hypothetical protein